MKKMNVLQWYAAVVCAFSAIIGTITGGGALYDIVQMSAPNIAISGQAYQAHQTNQAFTRWYTRRHSGMDKVEMPDNEEELTQLRKENFVSLLAEQKHDAIRAFVREMIIFLLASVLFLAHWRLLKKYATSTE